MRWAIAISALALAGCATDGTPPPAIQVKTVEVRVPVPVPCVDRKDIPAEPARVANRLTGKAGHDLLIVDQSALELRTWGQTMAAQLVACSRPAP